MATEVKQDLTFNAAKQLYAEQFGDAIVTNTYLKIGLLVMALVAGGLIYTNIKTVRMVQNFKPLVIRINDIGRAEAVNYDAMGYKPQDTEINSHECRNRRHALEMEAGSYVQPTGRLDFCKSSQEGNPTVLAWISLPSAPKTCAAEGRHFCSRRLAHAATQFRNLDE